MFFSLIFGNKFIFDFSKLCSNFLSLLLMGKIRRGMAERVPLKRIFTSGEYTMVVGCV